MCRLPGELVCGVGGTRFEWRALTLVVVRARRPPLELWVRVVGAGQADELRAVAPERLLLRSGHRRGHLLLDHCLARRLLLLRVAVVLERLRVREAAALVLRAGEEVAAAVAVAPVVVHLVELGLAAVLLQGDVLRARVVGGSDQTMSRRVPVGAAPALVGWAEAHAAVLVAVLVVHLEPSARVPVDAHVARANTRAQVLVVLLGPGHPALVQICRPRLLVLQHAADEALEPLLSLLPLAPDRDARRRADEGCNEHEPHWWGRSPRGHEKYKTPRHGLDLAATCSERGKADGEMQTTHSKRAIVPPRLRSSTLLVRPNTA